MKAKLLFLFFATAGMHAQTTHMIDWFFGVQTTETIITITAGDSVMWMWTDQMAHTVTSFPSADATFDSGTLIGIGQTFTQAFPDVGVSEYNCIFHNGMVGQITVQPALGVSDHQKRRFSLYPNPVNDILNVVSEESSIGHITIFDATGNKVMDTPVETPEAKIYMSNYPSGTYLVKIQTGNKSETISVIRN